MGSERDERLSGLLDGLLEGGDVLAAAALVGDRRSVLARAVAGSLRPAGEGLPESPLFDLASLSKPWTATLALRLDAEGELPLGLQLDEVWPQVGDVLARTTLAELLSHAAGLEAWAPLALHCVGPAEVPQLLLSGGLTGARDGTYSDLGPILWGLSARRVTGRDLGRLLAAAVLEPLGIPAGACTTRPAVARTVASPLDNRRERELAAAQGLDLPPSGPPSPGTVQDGNARFLGGFPGHAGLFATPEALWTLGKAWLGTPRGFLPAAARRAALAGPGRWLLGWERRRTRGSGGRALSERAFGHSGFTGGSLWVDPESERVFVLLAHRATPDLDLAPWRRRFHRLGNAF
ncbi:MAG: serine hydrolase domain-containing protein [Thermoanaerobaculia bacterium]